MLGKIYGNAFKVLAQKSFKLWGLSILATVLSVLVWLLFGLVPGVALFVSMLLQAGTVMMYLHAYRGEKVEGKHLFDAFKDGKTAARTIKGIGWSNIIIFLWSLIPIVGPIFAIIRGYQYCLVPYIVVTEPNGEPFDAYKISKERTKGYCGQMFLADLIPCVVIGVVFGIFAALSLIPYVGFVFAVILYVLTLVVSILYPFFMGLVHAGFYDEIMRNANAAPAPVAPAAPYAAPAAPTAPRVPAAQAAPYAPQAAPRAAAPTAPQYAAPTAPRAAAPQAAPYAPQAAPTAPYAPSAFCPRCGAKLEQGAKFCGNCGNRF